MKITSVSVVLVLVISMMAAVDMGFDVAQNASGATVYVGGGGPGNYSTIQEGLNAAIPGGTIFVYSGIYYENIVLNASFSISLVGENKYSTIIDGGGNGDVIYVKSAHTNISGFTIRDSGQEQNDAGIKLSYVFNCSIYNNIFFNNKIGIFIEGTIIQGESDNLFVFTGEAAGDRLGTSVDIAGDVNKDGYDDFIVGAYLNDEGGDNSGKVYVYSGFDGNILHTFNGSSNDDLIGYSVSGAGDVDNDGYDDVIIGAPWIDEGAINTGKAFIHSGKNGSLIYSYVGNHADSLGWSVSGAGDLNKDGFDDFIISAHLADSNGNDAGKVYVFSGISGSILYTFIGDNSQDRFGKSVSSAGDVDNDGYEDIIVGSELDYSPGSYAGYARVYSGKNGSILFTFKGEGYWDYFGSSVSGAGDVNKDGYDDVIIGAFGNDSSGEDAGRAYIYSGADGALLFSFDGEATDDEFGWSVSGARDVDSDGYDDVIIGAHHNCDGGLVAGKAYVFSGKNGKQIYSIIGEAPGNCLGTSVSEANDVNSDGVFDVIVGAPCYNQGGYAAGRAYVYSNYIPTHIIGNNITLNDFIENDYGVYLNSSGNKVYHNSFYSNTIQAYDEEENLWDDGYPSGGNYWDDYNGSDLYHGPNQDIPGGDGIGDVNYSIIIDSVDRYPLMVPYGTNEDPSYPPLACAGSDQTTNPGELVVFNGSDSSDIDGDITMYEWNFGDGSPKSYGALQNHIYNTTNEYVVTLTVIDNDDNIDMDVCVINVSNILNLEEGWNLISFPTIQSTSDIPTLFNSIEGEYDAIQWFDAMDSNGPWKHHKVGKEFGNDLQDVDETMGLWVNIIKPGGTLFIFNGTQPKTTQIISLNEGWNMVGYPSLTNHNRTLGLNNLGFGTEVDAIQWFDSSTKTWHFLEEGDSFEVGRGYWIHATTYCVWEVPL